MCSASDLSSDTQKDIIKYKKNKQNFLLAFLSRPEENQLLESVSVMYEHFSRNFYH
jgi:hypothetical protein